MNSIEIVLAKEKSIERFNIKSFLCALLQAVLTRRNSITGVAYKDDPTIMAWELMNEIRCPSDQSGRTVQVNNSSAPQFGFFACCVTSLILRLIALSAAFMHAQKKKRTRTSTYIISTRIRKIKI